MYDTQKLLLTTLKYCFAPKPVKYSHAYVEFIGVDDFTHGNWRDRYGTNGYSIVGIKEHLYSQEVDYIVPIDCPGFCLWEQESQKESALLHPEQPIRCIGRVFHRSEFDIYVNLGNDPQQISLYCVDYDNRNRKQVIEIYDYSNQLFHRISIDKFQNGVYLKYRGYGRFRIHISAQQPPPNAVLSAVFFD